MCIRLVVGKKFTAIARLVVEVKRYCATSLKWVPDLSLSSWLFALSPLYVRYSSLLRVSVIAWPIGPKDPALHVSLIWSCLESIMSGALLVALSFLSARFLWLRLQLFIMVPGCWLRVVVGHRFWVLRILGSHREPASVGGVAAM